MHGAVLGALFVLTASACGRGDASSQSDASNPEACGVSGCGGDIAGTWTVAAMCVHLTGQGTLTGIPACDSASKDAFDSAKVVPVGAQVVFADGSYTQSGTARAEFRYVYTNACLTAQSGLTASAETCSEVQANLTNASQPAACKFSGESCVCNMTQDIPMAQTGNYTVEGSSLSMDMDESSFCVHGDTAEVGTRVSGFKGSLSLERR